MAKKTAQTFAKRQKELARKARHHGVDRQAADVDADDPRHGHREHADVQAAEAADDDCQRERRDRNDRQVHGWRRDSIANDSR